MPMIGVGNFAQDRLDAIRNGIQALGTSNKDAAALAETLESQIIDLAEEVDRISEFLKFRQGYGSGSPSPVIGTISP